MKKVIIGAVLQMHVWVKYCANYLSIRCIQYVI